MIVYGRYEYFVMQMLSVCVLRASCGSSQCCILHDLQFVTHQQDSNRMKEATTWKRHTPEQVS